MKQNKIEKPFVTRERVEKFVNDYIKRKLIKKSDANWIVKQVLGEFGDDAVQDSKILRINKAKIKNKKFKNN